MLLELLLLALSFTLQPSVTQPVQKPAIIRPMDGDPMPCPPGYYWDTKTQQCIKGSPPPEGG